LNESAGAIVFTQQVAGLVVGVEDGPAGAAADLNPLAECVVGRRLGGGAIGQGLEASGVIVTGGDRGITGGVARGIVGVGAGEGAGDARNPVARGVDAVGRGGRAAVPPSVWQLPC